MAFIQCDFHSETLGMSTSMNVILPQTTKNQVGMEGVTTSEKKKVLWLLHGRSDNETIWCRRTSIERYVAALGIAVIMPSGGLSYYSNMASGPRYGDFFENELPELARSFFPLSDKREDNFIAGLSMGGYGAMRLALTYPERFAAVASLSGALDVVDFSQSTDPYRKKMFETVWGADTKLAGTPYDLLHMLKVKKESGVALPELFTCCGTDDFLLEDNRRFVANCGDLDIPIQYTENEGGHEWGYWDRMIQDVLKWLPLG